MIVILPALSPVEDWIVLRSSQREPPVPLIELLFNDIATSTAYLRMTYVRAAGYTLSLAGSFQPRLLFRSG